MRRALALLLVLCLLLVGCAAAPDTQDPNRQQNWETYVLAFPSTVLDQKTIDAVQSRVNTILEEQLGIHVQFLTFPFENYDKEMREVLAGSDQVDVMLCMGTYVENWLFGNLLPLDDLLEEYGQDIVAEVEDMVIQSCTVNSAVYGIPNIRDYAITTDTYYLNTEVLERNGISADEIHTVEDLERIFSVIHENEPDTVILSTYLQSLASNRRYLNPQTPFVSALDEERDCYVNYFATEEYRSILSQIRGWYQEGYVGLYSEAGKIIADHGTAMALARCGKPGAAVEVSQMYGAQYQEFCFGSSVITQDVYTAITYTITKNTSSEEQSMRLLNELYQNAELNELLSEVLATWMLPNLFLTKVNEGYPDDLWEQTKIFNQEAERAPDVGFVFDPTSVMREYLDICEIYARYRPILESGIVDPDDGQERMLAELDAAGIDKLLAEQNRQYTDWKKSREH